MATSALTSKSDIFGGFLLRTVLNICAILFQLAHILMRNPFLPDKGWLRVSSCVALVATLLATILSFLAGRESLIAREPSTVTIILSYIAFAMGLLTVFVLAISFIWSACEMEHDVFEEEDVSIEMQISALYSNPNISVHCDRNSGVYYTHNKVTGE